MPPFKSAKSTGFSLAEVLIALALLGVIAAFAIPKVLTSQAEQRKIVTFKETYGALSEVMYAGALTQTYVPNGASFFNYLSWKVNAVKVCPTNATTEGCWNAPTDGMESTQPGLVMPNGAVVVGLDLLNYATNSQYGPPYYGYGSGLLIDYNGPDGPNKHGEDWLNLFFCADPVTGSCMTPDTGNKPVRAGYMAPGTDTSSYVGSAAHRLFQKITQ